MNRKKMTITNGQGGIRPYESDTHRMEFMVDWKTPENNTVDHWVLTEKQTGAIVDHDKYRYDLAERHGYDLVHAPAMKEETHNG